MPSRSAFGRTRGNGLRYVATEDDCPTPGVVSINIYGKTTQHLNLQEDCALRAAVIASLPRGRAEEASETRIAARSDPTPSRCMGAP